LAIQQPFTQSVWDFDIINVKFKFVLNILTNAFANVFLIEINDMIMIK